MQLAHIYHVIELPLNGDNEEWGGGWGRIHYFISFIYLFCSGRESAGRLHKANAGEWKQMEGVMV